MRIDLKSLAIGAIVGGCTLMQLATFRVLMKKIEKEEAEKEET